jgi:Trypsin-like peptidase domain
MFEQAAQQHFEWHCQVGGTSIDRKGICVGMGCFLTDNIVLSAAHVWGAVREKYEWPCVVHSTGGFRCEVLREWPAWDVIVLRTKALIRDSAVTKTQRTPRPSQPVLSQERMYLGREVGVFSRLSLMNEEDSLSLFTSGRVSSFHFPTDDNQRLKYGLANTVVQKGFSGSAVFLADGSIVGVLVQTLSFPVDLEHPSLGRYVLPIVSPLYEIREEIAGLLF